MLPSPDILNEFEHGKFVLSNLAAKRAKQLQEGAQPLVRASSNHPLTIALAEIAAGKIKPSFPDITTLDSGEVEQTLLIEETVPAELGMLLPSLDDVEILLDHEEDVDHDDEVEPETSQSLSDLVDEEIDVEDTVKTDDDEATLSLSDIAEQETSLDDDAEEE